MARNTLVILTLVLTALAGLGGWLALRTSPLEAAIGALDARGYRFESHTGARPAISRERATTMATSDSSSRRPSAGPLAGFVTYDGPGDGGDLDRHPVYLFVVDDFAPGPVIPSGAPTPEAHAVFVFREGDAHAIAAVPMSK